MKINKILVANRGEIALRVMKTCRKLGIKTVAVYSEVDRKMPFVRYADEAILLGAAPSSESYLAQDKIIAAAKQTGADAIHPGYGFLSENASFSDAVKKADIIFIGPDAHAIEVMGSKLAAKETVKKYDIPLVPGTEEAISDVEEAKQIAQEIGFPILIKASAGGGGKGMRIVEDANSLQSQMERAISEAKSSFGDGAVFIEKYVTSPRHIEIQVLADNHGNVVHLFERECSVQRRHQKVVEEAPSAVLTPELRAEMGDCAVRVAKSVNYTGAGTVEFLLDENHNFYFLEMNTRLQVEHPVTEMITGIDLVAQQISVAEGNPLSFSQSDLKIYGHSLELRVYAEDVENGFLPSTGTLSKYRPPANTDQIRVDDGYEEGLEIPIYYDPMISKLVTYAPTRAEAIQKMIEAIDDYQVEGISTTLGFGKFVCEHDAFTSGDFDTHFVKNYFQPESSLNNIEEMEAAGLVTLLHHLSSKKKLKLTKQNNENWGRR